LKKQIETVSLSEYVPRASRGAQARAHALRAAFRLQGPGGIAEGIEASLTKAAMHYEERK
jgi:hypothetical protein